MPGFTLGKSYPVIEKRHRFLTHNAISKQVVTGYCLCRETLDDNDKLVQFTEQPSATWHKPMQLFSSFDPAVAALQDAPYGWTDKLLSYATKLGFQFYPAQLREAASLLSKDSALVTAEVGSGKTLLASVFIGLRTRRSHTIVIVAPKGVHPQWQEELSRFCKRRAISIDDVGSLAAGVNLINVESFRAGKKFNRPVDLIIADEGHFLASGSLQSEEFLKTTEGIPLRLLLTATPIPNRLEELFLQLGWLSYQNWNSAEASMPSTIFPYRPRELEKFKTDYCLSDGAIGVASPERINKLLEPFLVTLTKSECRADQPPLKLRFVPCSIPVSAFQSWEKCFKPGTPSNTETDFLTMGVRAAGKVAKAWQETCHWLREGQQILIVSVRTEPLSQLAACLSSNSIPFSKIHSTETTGIDYAQQAEDFRTGKSRVMLMGMKCAQSYNFPNCAHVIIIGSDFTYGMFHQALGRCHRLNSMEPVYVSVLYYPGTNEAIKLQTVIAKATQAATVLGERDYVLQKDIPNDARVISDSAPEELLKKVKPAPIGA